MAKDYTPPETKVNHKLSLKPSQIKPRPNSTKGVDFPTNEVIQITLTKTPPDVEIIKFYQFSLNKPQDKHRPLKHKASQILFKNELKQSSDQA
jgi:hypothetical protein